MGQKRTDRARIETRTIADGPFERRYRKKKSRDILILEYFHPIMKT